MSPLPLTPRQERLLRVIETSLRARGFVPTIREMGTALGLTSIRGVTDHLAALEQKGYIRRTPGHRRAVEILRPLSPAGDSIPILGRVAAGRPLLAVENVEGMLSLGPELLGKGTHFALRVQGDSMIEADIQDGDYVIVRQQEAADPGDIVIALLGEEATVKRLRKKGKAFFLEAANPAYAPIPLTRSVASPRLVGKMIGLYRRHNGKP
jgi:repressor LexA